MSVYSDAVLSAGVTHYYRMGSDDSLTDATGGGTNGGFPDSAPTEVTGLLTNDADLALAFDFAAAEYGRIVSLLPPGAGDWTAELWVDLPETQKGSTADKGIFGRSSIASNAGFRIMVTAGADRKIKVFYGDGTNTVTLTSETLSADVHHVATAVDRTTDEAYLYIDAELVDTVDISAVGGIEFAGDSGRGYVAAVLNNTTLLADGYFTGTLDEIAVYFNQALAPETITEHYLIGVYGGLPPGPEGSLALYSYSNVAPSFADVDPPPVGAYHYANVAPAWSDDPPGVWPYHYSNVLAGLRQFRRRHRSHLPEGAEPYRGDWVMEIHNLGGVTDEIWSYPVGDTEAEVGDFTKEIREDDQGKMMRVRVRAMSLDPIWGEAGSYLVVAMGLFSDSNAYLVGAIPIWFPGQFEPGVWQEREIEYSLPDSDPPIDRFQIVFQPQQYDEEMTLIGPLAFDSVYIDALEIDLFESEA